MHKRSFLIKDILTRHQDDSQDGRDNGRQQDASLPPAECFTCISAVDAYLCNKPEVASLHPPPALYSLNSSSASIWPSLATCISCINPITSPATASWPAVYNATVFYGANEKLAQTANKDNPLNGLYYAASAHMGQHLLDNYNSFEANANEAHSALLSSINVSESMESGNHPNSSSTRTTPLTTPSSASNRKVRRNRTVFTELQLMGLERRFDSQKYLSTPDRAELARALGLTQLQVKTWYQNRRMKWKKQVMQGGCPIPPTKPKGRPKKNSIPSLGMSLETSAFLASSLALGVGVGPKQPPSLLQPNVSTIQPFN